MTDQDKPEDAPLGNGGKQRAVRKNLLLSAEIEAQGVTSPVRIRNLSESGAMIEGAALPLAGASVTLRRHDIELAGSVVWRVAGRCGIKFDTTTFVEEWVAGHRMPELVYGQGQARVDAIQAAVRRGDLLEQELQNRGSLSIAPSEMYNRAAEELAYVRRLLEGAAEEFTDDPIILQRHMQTLQNLDMACQIVGHLEDVIRSTDPAAAAAAVTLAELKTRLLRKPAL